MKKDGEILREIAFKKGYRNASRLADDMGISRVTVNNDFNDEKISLKILEKYTRFLDFTFDDFENLRKVESSNNQTSSWKEIALNYKQVIAEKNETIAMLREQLNGYKSGNNRVK